MRRLMPKLATTAHNWSRYRSATECGSNWTCDTGAVSNMTQVQPAALPTFSGKTSGGIPNLFWRRLSFEQLRAQQKYHGLPPVEQLQFTSTTDYRQVRQDTQLWTQLHQGLLTTGKLNAALGFYEPGAARRLGIPRDRINHNSLLSAIANLRQPAWGLAALNLPATPTECQVNTSASAIADEAPVLAPQAALKSEYQAVAAKLASNAQAAAVLGKHSKADKNRQRRLRKKLHHQMQQQQAAHNTAACDLASADPTPYSVAAESTADVYASPDARRKRCIAVADRGEGGIRMAWGSAQEASALFGLMYLYPNSQLEEVGLCWVDARQQIPASWGISVDNLPPLGASPDGLIRHKANTGPPLPAELPVPTSLLNGVQQQATQAGGQQHPQHLQSVPQASQHACQQQAAVEQSRLSTQAAPAVDAEFEALLAKLAVSSRQAPAWTPAQQPGHDQSSGYQQSITAASPASDDTQRRQTAMQLGTEPTVALPDVMQHQQPVADGSAEQDWFEAVEIKNVCPFRELRQVSANGKARRIYHLSDPGPYSRVPCHFVPQLQMEMLASGAQSALVVSRSATKAVINAELQGMRVFRMQRHERFLQQMLSTISQLYIKYVKTDSLPPFNMFFEQAAYQEFLGTTLQVADSVQVISDLDSQALPDVWDSKMFL